MLDFAELPPVVYIHALVFEYFLFIPYASTLAAEPGHFTKINKNNVVLHISPMMGSPTQAFAFPFFESVFLSLQSGFFFLCIIHFQRNLEGLRGRVLPHQELPGSKCEQNPGRHESQGQSDFSQVPKPASSSRLMESLFHMPYSAPKLGFRTLDKKLLQPCPFSLCFLYKRFTFSTQI